MKKMIKNLMLVAVAAMAFVGCSQVEIEEVQRPIEERYFTLNIETENDVTRTYVDGTEIKWNAQGETIGIIARGYNAENADWPGAYNKCVQSSEATLNENIASFTANIPVIYDSENKGIEATQYAVAAFYPYRNMGDYPSTHLTLNLPSTQTPTQGSYDPAADILVSKQEKIFDAVGDNTSVNFKFGRLVSIVEMTVKGIPAGEKISTIEVSASKPLSGYNINFNLIADNDHEMEFDDRLYIYEYGNEGVTLNMNGLEATGEDKVWFTTLPQDLANGSIQVVVKTDVGTYLADINLSGKQLNLKRADINRFAVTVSAPQPEHFVFTEADAYLTNYGGTAYFTVTFKNETSQFTTDFYTHKTAIESGEWLMASSQADGTLNTYATLNNDPVSTEGKATVVRDGENYTINFTDLYYNNNIIPFTAEFKGTIAINNGNMGAEFVADYTATQWLWLGATSGWDTNSYAVTGENLSVDLHFFKSQATETSLAEGWYNWVSDGYGLIYISLPYNFAIKNGLTINGTAITPVSGSAEVIANNETEYTINLTFTDNANNVYKIQYVGALNVKEEVEIEAIPVVSMTTGALYGQGPNYTYTFTVDDNTLFSLVFSTNDATSTSITARDYTNVAYASYVQSGNFAIDTSKNYKFNGVKVKPTEASTVKVSLDGDVYTILMNFLFSDATTLVYVYEGKIGGTSGGNEEPVEPTKLATPVVNIDIVVKNQAALSWNAIAGAGSYTVTYKSETTPETTTTVYTNEVILSNLAWDTTYTVTVVANPADETLNYASDASTPVNVVVGSDPNAGSVTYDPWVCDATISGGNGLSGFTITLEGKGENTDTLVLSPVRAGNANLDVTVTKGTETGSGKARIDGDSGLVVFNVTVGKVTYIGTSSNSLL